VPESAGGADRRISASAISSAARLRARSDRSPSALACKRQAMRFTSQTLLCDGVGSPKTSANLTRSSETRSRGNAAISPARFGSMGDSPWGKTARCPPPPSPLSLGTLRIARQSPSDSRRSSSLQNVAKTLVFPPNLLWGVPPGWPHWLSPGGPPLGRDRSCFTSRRICHERCLLPRHRRHVAVYPKHAVWQAQLVRPFAIQPG